ncbi:MAG TPA: hypothetical protein VFB04_17800 [Terriglobales bacterium]|nr:hypothetical protein [Terriglobales bacterium]
MPNTHRLAGRFFSVLISLAVALALTQAGYAAPTLCQVNDTVYRADGTPAQGDVVILWPAFTTADGSPVAAGQVTVQLGAQGQFSASLAPNAGAMPAGTYYRVTYKLNDDSVQPGWQGQYRVVSDFLTTGDIVPGYAVEVAAPSRGAEFSAIVRKVGVQVISLGDDRSLYAIDFANDAAEPLAFQLEAITLPAPVTTVYTTGAPSSSLYIDSLIAAQITDVIASQVTMDAGAAPPRGGGIEVRRSDGGWGPGDGGNLAGRFTTQMFTLPRLSRAQSYYLRQYDASSPAKYSRYSALLYVDYPL